MAIVIPPLSWFFNKWYKMKGSSSSLYLCFSALFSTTMATIIHLKIRDPLNILNLPSCKILLITNWTYIMLADPTSMYVFTVHYRHEAVWKNYSYIYIYYIFCSLIMMHLRILLLESTACGRGKEDRFIENINSYYFFPIL
uniref:Uncharacterized protein n=1 Tax=Pongo abelii TaxID=9601 RepID=A0A8I5UDI8_PONAB